ncbi:MAG: hypothetical protein M3R15_15625, partial [Acidobacteriota bacterium]|nr:hypothetical protein [Acidobacteriota bacterium]
MKRCPQCNRVESDDTLTFCRADGTPLVRDSGAVAEGAGTLKFGAAPATGETERRILPTGETLSEPTAPTTDLDGQRTSGSTRELGVPKSRRGVVLVAAALAAVALAAAAFYFLRKDATAVESVAVMPFVNESGNADNEYLSDGMTETLINSLSQLPNLNVKA